MSRDSCSVDWSIQSCSITGHLFSSCTIFLQLMGIGKRTPCENRVLVPHGGADGLHHLFESVDDLELSFLESTLTPLLVSASSFVNVPARSTLPVCSIWSCLSALLITYSIRIKSVRGILAPFLNSYLICGFTPGLLSATRKKALYRCRTWSWSLLCLAIIYKSILSFKFQHPSCTQKKETQKKCMYTCNNWHLIFFFKYLQRMSAHLFLLNTKLIQSNFSEAKAKENTCRSKMIMINKMLDLDFNFNISDTKL